MLIRNDTTQCCRKLCPAMYAAPCGVPRQDVCDDRAAYRIIPACAHFPKPYRWSYMHCLDWLHYELGMEVRPCGVPVTNGLPPEFGAQTLPHPPSNAILTVTQVHGYPAGVHYRFEYAKIEPICIWGRWFTVCRFQDCGAHVPTDFVLGIGK